MTDTIAGFYDIGGLKIASTISGAPYNIYGTIYPYITR